MYRRHITCSVHQCCLQCRVVEYGGSWAVCSPEQSDKTVGIAAIGLVSARKHKPCVAMVCDLKSNAKKVQEGLQTLLRPFDIEVRFDIVCDAFTALPRKRQPMHVESCCQPISACSWFVA